MLLALNSFACGFSLGGAPYLWRDGLRGWAITLLAFAVLNAAFVVGDLA